MVKPMQTTDSSSRSDGRRVSLFKNGVNQALRIPRDLELPTTEALLFREGDRLVIEAYPPTPSLLTTLERLEPINETFPDVDETLPDADPVDL